MIERWLSGAAIGLLMLALPQACRMPAPAPEAESDAAGSESTPPSSPPRDYFAERIRSRFPDVRLVDHKGISHRFYEDLVEGHLVLINFIYTQCDGI